MILSAEDMQWVTNRLKIYDIKYQEVYNEVFDHIVSAVEVKRVNGDARNIEQVFQDVVDTHFGGYRGIKELATSQAKLINKRINGLFKATFKSYLNWGTLAFAVVTVLIAFTLPANTFVYRSLSIAIFLLAISPSIYTFIYVSRNITFRGRKPSLILGQLITQTGLPVIILNVILYLPTLFLSDDKFRFYKHLPIPVLMAALLFFMLLNLSTISICCIVVKKRVSR